MMAGRKSGNRRTWDHGTLLDVGLTFILVPEGRTGLPHETYDPWHVPCRAMLKSSLPPELGRQNPWPIVVS